MTGILLAAVGNSYGAKPLNTVAPAVTGTAQVRQTLSCSTGTWTAAPPSITYTYQWKANGSPISGATSSTYNIAVAYFGQSISCDVTATNIVGSTTASSNSTAAVVANVPAAPTIGTATATGSTTATVSYTAPADNGGATITSYTATSSPGGLTGTLNTAGSGTITVTGLVPSTSYTFTVRATNSVGTSAPSASSNSITTQEAYWIATTDDYAGYPYMAGANGSNVIITGMYSGYAKFFSLSSAGSLVTSTRWGASSGAGSISTYTNEAVNYTNSTSTFYLGGRTNGGYTPERGIVVGISSSGGLAYNTGAYNTNGGGREVLYGSTTNDSSGSVYARGYTHYFGTAYGAVTKFNSSGSIVWSKVVSQFPTVMEGIDANTTYVAVCSKVPSYAGPRVLNSSDGTLNWGTAAYQVFGGGGINIRNAFIGESGNNFYFVFYGGFNGFSSGAAIFKFNSSGTVQWGRAIDADRDTWRGVYAVDGFIYFYGRYTNAGAGTSLAVVKMDTSGNTIWSRRLYSNAIGLGQPGRIYVIGSSYYFPFANGSNTAILKAPTDGSRTGTYGNFVYDTGGPSLNSVSLSGASTLITVDNTESLTSFGAPVGQASFTPTITLNNM